MSKQIQCPLCPTGVLKPNAGHGLCRKHYTQKYRFQKREEDRRKKRFVIKDDRDDGSWTLDSFVRSF